MSDNSTSRSDDLKRWRDDRMKHEEFHAKQIEAFSLAAMKAPALVAAGAIFAQLGFYSANFDRLAGDQIKLVALNTSLRFLVVSLFLTVLAPCAAYFSQILFLDSLWTDVILDEPPYYRETRRGWWAKVIGAACRWICILLVFGSIACLLVGGWHFLKLTA